MLVVCWLAMVMPDLGLTAWMPIYFQRVRHLSVAEAGLVTGIGFLAAGFAGSIVGGMLADVRRRRGTQGRQLDVALGTALLAIPALLVVLLGTSVVAVVTATVALLTAMRAYYPGVASALSEVMPLVQLGLGFGVVATLQGIVGVSLAPFVIGYVSDVTGSLTIALFLPLCGVVIAALVALVARQVITRMSRPPV
jgi:sugar phosphate permease